MASSLFIIMYYYEWNCVHPDKKNGITSTTKQFNLTFIFKKVFVWNAVQKKTKLF